MCKNPNEIQNSEHKAYAIDFAGKVKIKMKPSISFGPSLNSLDAFASSNSKSPSFKFYDAQF